ncbi:MAG: hypothetical protein COA36_15415 [Desulfotalea sp.]|nr:MAG: hypothetical protein COA36_15415 [Desulfotalea sp.]
MTFCFSESYFAFCNRKRDVVKVLFWANNGFCIWMTHLEEDVFCWLGSGLGVVGVSQTILSWRLY